MHKSNPPLTGYAEPIDLLFLDGWKEQYLPPAQMLEPNFTKNALLVADNLGMEGVKKHLRYVRNSPKYRSETIGTDKGGTEFTYFIKICTEKQPSSRALPTASAKHLPLNSSHRTGT